MRKKAFRGSLTIEMSLLLPLLVFLIWNILYLAFFLYDQSTVLQGNYCTALRTERVYGSEEEKWTVAEEKYHLAVRKKVVCGTIEKEIAIAEKGGVSVKTELKMRAPAAGFYDSVWQGVQMQEAEKWQPVTFIRNCRKAEDVLDFLQKESE